MIINTKFLIIVIILSFHKLLIYYINIFKNKNGRKEATRSREGKKGRRVLTNRMSYVRGEVSKDKSTCHGKYLYLIYQCQISEIFDDGAYVELLEYNRIKGMLLSSELSRKRVNYVKRLIKEGREEVLRVLRIDPQKGFFDLSKKSVKVEEIEEFKETYLKSKTVHGIMKLLSVKAKQPIEELYEMFCWPLYKKYGHAYIAFKNALK